MWFWRRRRRRQPPPALLPALLPGLDRLAELVEGVVALLEDTPASPPPPPDDPSPPPEPAGWVAFAGSPVGYRLVEREGEVPARGALVELDGVGHRVLRLGPSPLPGDARRCAFLEREEPSAEGRTFEP